MTRSSIGAWLVLTVVACFMGCERGNREDPTAKAPPPSSHTGQAHTASFDVTRDSVRRDSIARVRQDSINRTLPGYVIDSILPVEETLRRFRTKVGGDPVTAFADASNSRDALVARFVDALNRSDSTDLRAMVVSAREFADLIYPESPSVKPPYTQDPSLVWSTIQNHSISGYTRLLRRLGSKHLTLVRYHCDGTSGRQGQSVLWSGCMVDLAVADGSVSTHRLFGSIIERDHQFKFMSYRNEF